MNYKNHDRIGILTSVATVVVSWLLVVPAWVFGPIFLGCLVGTIWLSPDLDLHHSRPTKRWGWFKPIWKRYAKRSKHRGISHTPVVGTLTRVLYLLTRFLGLPLFTVVAVVCYFPPIAIHLVLFVCGVELYCLTHIAADTLSSSWKRLIN